jgi:hypothetical protein
MDVCPSLSDDNANLVRNLGHGSFPLHLPLASNLRERRRWLEWGTVSGVMVGAPFAQTARWAILGAATGISPDIPPVVRAEAVPHAIRPDRLRSLMSWPQVLRALCLWSEWTHSVRQR